MMKKFGVEVEMESDEWLDNDSIYSSINNCYEAKDDGSLEYGTECTSVKLNNINQVFDFIDESRAVMMDYGGYTASPCAIHIHVSNHKKPINLHKISYAFYEVFEQIRKNNNNGLMHYRNSYISNADLRRNIETNLIMRDESEFYKFCNQSSNYLAQYRPTTLRTRIAGYNSATLEFRPIPNNRSYHKYFETWKKIYSAMIEKTEKMHLIEIEKFSDNVINIPTLDRLDALSYQFLEFKSFMDLTFKELDILLHYQNRERRNIFDDILAGGKNDNDIMKKLTYQYESVESDYEPDY